MHHRRLSVVTLYAIPLAVVATVAVGAACSSSTDDRIIVGPAADAGSDAETKPGDPLLLARAQCAAYNRCFPTFVQLNYGGMEQCEAILGADFTIAFSQAGAALTAEQVGVCTAKVDSIACDVLNVLTPECDFKGTLEDGEPCSAGGQCTSGSCFVKPNTTCGVCTSTSTEGGDCTKAECAVGQNLRCSDKGKCAVMVEDGQPCNADKPCRNQHECNGGVCHSRLGKGEKCSSFSVTCDVTKGLFCFPNETGDSVCDELLLAKVGEKCGPDEATKKTTFCAGSTCSDQAGGGTCVPYLKAGAACGGDDLVQCEPTLVCTKDKKCASLGCE